MLYSYLQQLWLLPELFAMSLLVRHAGVHFWHLPCMPLRPTMAHGFEEVKNVTGLLGRPCWFQDQILTLAISACRLIT